MERTLVVKTLEKVGQEVKLAGWVNILRDHGKVLFIDLRDRSGFIQLVISAGNKEIFEKAKKCRSEFIIEVEGSVKERPEKLINKNTETGKLEIAVSALDIISEVEGELPFEINQLDLSLSLQTLLENRNLTLRNEKIKAIFKVFAQVLDSYQSALKKADFQEIKSPKILCSASEGGANFFKIKYFKQEAFLAQSPQFYKQMGVGIFERVFEIGPVFRAEPHFTSRHVNEYTSLDAEFGFIENFEEIMKQLEEVVWAMMEEVGEKCSKQLEMYGAVIPKRKEIPRIKLSEALKVIEKEYKKKSEEFDIDPEGERLICRYVKEKYDCDFVFLTHYPTAIRPMYAMPCEEDKKLTCSFDLLFRGVEIATGGQRIHNYQQLLASVKKHKFDPKNFKYYLEVFKLGMPPHGGWGMGSERIVQKILGLKSVKEAVLYPRDVKRIVP